MPSAYKTGRDCIHVIFRPSIVVNAMAPRSGRSALGRGTTQPLPRAALAVGTSCLIFEKLQRSCGNLQKLSSEKRMILSSSDGDPTIQ